MTPRVVGLDLSLTGTGVALGDGSTCTVTTKLRGCERLAWIRDQIEYVVQSAADLARHDVGGSSITFDPAYWPLVVIEDYAFSRAAAHSHQLGELGGVIRLALHENGIPFACVVPSCLKKYATGKGNANKDQMRDAARDRFGMAAGVTSDECDAAWLRAMGLDHLGHPPVAMPALNRQALTKVTWP